MERLKKGERYWAIRIFAGLIETFSLMELEQSDDEAFFSTCNYFHSKEEAEAMANKLRAVLKGAEVIKMPSQDDIIKAARGRAERHSIAEAELHKGLGNLYGYSRIENAEIASFEAGVEWLKSQLTKED